MVGVIALIYSSLSVVITAWAVNIYLSYRKFIITEHKASGKTKTPRDETAIVG